MSDAAFSRVDKCRICGDSPLEIVIDLGTTPLANAYIDPERRDEPEPRFPLEAVRCRRCRLLQLSIVVRPDLMFRDYMYATSASAPMLEHFERLATELVDRYAAPGSLAVEVGSNDGVLLRFLRDRGARVLGIEPARNLAAAANASGLETWDDFFGGAVADRIVERRGRAAVVVANNVLAHIHDLRDVVTGLDALLAPDGVFVAEVPYVGSLVSEVEYDTIYHEHLSYFALAPLELLFSDHGLQLFDVTRLSTHGGSIRIHVGRTGAHGRTSRLASALEAERAEALGEAATYERFAGRVRESREKLRALVDELRSAGRSVAAIGATAKSCTLLNYCGIGAESIAFVADSTPLKQGRLTPGTHIPIEPERALHDRRPDYALLLAWNYADAIVRRHADYVARGGRFIHPIPLARVLP